MGVTVNVNGLSQVHKGSGGVVMATIPDVCKTPAPPGPPVPIPYPNIAMSSDLMKGTNTVKVDGCSAAVKGSEFFKSTGDEPGVAGGVKSGVNMSKATWLLWSPNVFYEGKNACRLTDKMLMNKGNTVSIGGCMNPPLTVEELIEKLCDYACKCKGAAGGFQRCVAKQIEDDYYDGKYPKDEAQLWRETSFKKTDDGFQMIMNKAGNAPTSNPFTPGGGIRPDCIATDGAGNPLKVIEMKFPGDSLNANQSLDPGSPYNQAAEDLGTEYEVIEVEEDCDCWNDDGPPGEPVPVPAPAPEEEKEPFSLPKISAPSPQQSAVLAGAALVLFGLAVVATDGAALALLAL